MIVNSFPFWVFFIVVFAVYYLPAVRDRRRLQNLWLLLVSYFFYGYADWRMLPLLFGATAVFYALGICLKLLMNEERWDAASRLTTLGACLGVGVLLYFKYLNFFGEGFADLLRALGFNLSWTTLNIVLPVGVSFFTFKLISYVVEIHRERIEPTRDFIDFAVYVAFFPTILSGPIDRPGKFLPQLEKPHRLDYSLAADGCRQILWGMFMKMCIADNLTVATDRAWSTYQSGNGTFLLAAALIYPFQMYADFAGYSDMAIGVGKILGFRVARNFNHPFLARNVAEYWRRWHMSLTTWITDYVFMPLNIAFRNIGKAGVILAAIINLVLIGLWHGANWTYAVFGLYHGLLFIPIILSGALGKNKKLKSGRLGLPKIADFGKMLFTYILVAIGMLVFRAPDITSAFGYGVDMLSSLSLAGPHLDIAPVTYLFLAVLIICDWVFRKREYPILPDLRIFRPRTVRILAYAVFFVIIMWTAGQPAHFIYFQF